MKNRKERLPIIIDLLTHKNIGSQDELLSELDLLGFHITQATLSRDLKQLKTSKVPNGIGGYRYVIASSGDDDSAFLHSTAYHPLSKPTINSIDRSSNIIVIKSPVNHAKAVANAFDQLHSMSILAAIAITDTVLLVLAPGVTGSQVYSLLTRIIDPETVDNYRRLLDEY